METGGCYVFAGNGETAGSLLRKIRSALNSERIAVFVSSESERARVVAMLPKWLDADAVVDPVDPDAQECSTPKDSIAQVQIVNDVQVVRPTVEQCNRREIVIIDGRRFLAAAYPQLGGYWAPCLVDLSQSADDGGCFDAYVWHNGEFPFQEGDGRLPEVLHHCSTEQFIQFGNEVLEAQKANPAIQTTYPKGR